jgi:ribosomal protein L37AE/L43A
MPENHSETHRLPEWAPRLPQEKIRQLYENDAQGIYDEELINDVGFMLLARCQSFIEANQAVGGQAPCPACGTIVEHTRQKEEILHCSSCGWALSWGEYFRTIQHHQLSGAEPVIELFQDYIKHFPRASTLQEKVLHIDRLIHGFHWYYKTEKPTRPVAVNLIQGRLQEVMVFLGNLSYGEQNTPGFQENRAEWEENIETARSWYRKDEK